MLKQRSKTTTFQRCFNVEIWRYFNVDPTSFCRLGVTLIAPFIFYKSTCPSLIITLTDEKRFLKMSAFLAGRRQEASLCRLENELKIALSKSGDFSVASKVCKVSTQSLGQTLSLEHSYRFWSFGCDKQPRSGDITSLNMPNLGGHFWIFMALLLVFQASARNELVSRWYCTFSYRAIFDKLTGPDSNENDEFGSISDVLNMGSSPPPMHHVLYSIAWAYRSLSVCLCVCPALRPTGLVFSAIIPFDRE